MTTYHQTNPTTGELLSGPHEARVCPRSGQPLLPRGAVTTAPDGGPAEGNVWVWSGSTWDTIEDHRGEKGFVSGVQKTIQDLGPLPEGWSEEDPSEEPEPEPIPEGRKVWPNSSTFLKTFTSAEQAAISLSTDPTIAALRLLLITHPGEVWSDDPDIVLGLDTLVNLGIISQERREEIEQTTPQTI